jgi:ubiquinone/menaquinone biosynthesis C-methylase UbiE
MNKRLISEIKHGEKILSNAGDVWGWETPAGKIRWQRRVKMLTENCQKGDKVLELGCGTGYFTREISKLPCDVTAIDISPVLLEKARSQLPNVNFFVEDAHNTGFLDNSFDKIIGSSVLHHLEIEKALEEIYRVLKKGGSIYFTEPNMLNPQIALQKNIPWLKNRMGDSPFETAFFRWELIEKLRKKGFENIQVIPFDFFHPSIPISLFFILKPFCIFLEKIFLINQFSGSLFISATK